MEFRSAFRKISRGILNDAKCKQTQHTYIQRTRSGLDDQAQDTYKKGATENWSKWPNILYNNNNNNKKNTFERK